jgi:hypothetical protein
MSRKKDFKIVLFLLFQNLVQTKKHLHDEKKVCRENLDRLHYFMQSFQR